jgi:glycosyltransferase involved in cell wall biosynthesis/protein-tyrosine-phosphatase
MRSDTVRRRLQMPFTPPTGMLARSGETGFARPLGLGNAVVAPNPVRICHVASGDLWAGAEVQLATTAAYLSQQPDFDLRVVLFNEGRLADELRRERVAVTVIDEQRRNAVGLVVALARFLRRNRIEILHTHRYKENVLGSLAAKLVGVRHVVRTVHGLGEPMNGWEGLKFRLYDSLDRAALRLCADRIVAVSDETSRALQGAGQSAAALRRIHNGIDLSKIASARSRDEVRRELGIGPPAVLIGTAGRLAPVKAQDCFLRAGRLILQKERHARFIIAGDGPLKTELMALATRLGIERECVFLGARSDIFDLVAALDLFVLPSLDEGIPMALLEAMALERPLVASNVGGIPEVITHRINGLLVEAGDEQALADASLELIRDPLWATVIGKRARQTVEERFSHRASGRALTEVYKEVGPRASGLASATAAVRTDAPGTLALGWLLLRGSVEYAARTIVEKARKASERARMMRIRRRPAALAGALPSASNILILCHGNIIRSPFAAARMVQRLAGSASVTVASAGLGAVSGRPAHPTAVDTASPHRVDLGGHAACAVTPELVAASDLIFVMEIPQLLEVRRRFPAAYSRTFLLTCLAPGTPLEIHDPIDQDEPVFRACFDDIRRAADAIVDCLAGSLTR